MVFSRKEETFRTEEPKELWYLAVRGDLLGGRTEGVVVFNGKEEAFRADERKSRRSCGIPGPNRR